MNQITYLKGDATNPQVQGPKIIAHICNDIGAWGKGFVLAVSKKWERPELSYKRWKKTSYYLGAPFSRGEIQLIKVGEDTWVANMIAQEGIYPKHGVPPIRYDSLKECLVKLADDASVEKASVHMPRIGCGLAGGKWDRVEAIINETLVQRKVPVYIYDLK